MSDKEKIQPEGLKIMNMRLQSDLLEDVLTFWRMNTLDYYFQDQQNSGVQRAGKTRCGQGYASYKM